MKLCKDCTDQGRCPRCKAKISKGMARAKGKPKVDKARKLLNSLPVDSRETILQELLRDPSLASRRITLDWLGDCLGLTEAKGV